MEMEMEMEIERGEEEAGPRGFYRKDAAAPDHALVPGLANQRPRWAGPLIWRRITDPASSRPGSADQRAGNRESRS